MYKVILSHTLFIARNSYKHPIKICRYTVKLIIAKYNILYLYNIQLYNTKLLFGTTVTL